MKKSPNKMKEKLITMGGVMVKAVDCAIVICEFAL